MMVFDGVMSPLANHYYQKVKIPVKPLTPEVRLKKGLGILILHSEHNLQFHA